MLIMRGQVARISGTNPPPQWEALNRMDMVYMTSLEMLGNGVRTGMIATKTAVCCGVVIGSAILSTCGWLAAPTTLQIVEAAASGFDVYQMYLHLNRRKISTFYHCPVSHKHSPETLKKPRLSILTANFKYSVKSDSTEIHTAKYGCN